MKNLIALSFSLSLCACASIDMPPGTESKNVFTREVDVPYQDAYRTVAKQMRACYRVIGLLGNGYDVQADLDTTTQSGRVEVYYVGFTGAQKPEDSMFSRTVVVAKRGEGAEITTSGTTPKIVYLTHQTIPTWLAGIDSCAPRK
jgi:hypothetical protein